MKRREVITIVVAVLVVGLLFAALKLSGNNPKPSVAEEPVAEEPVAEKPVTEEPVVERAPSKELKSMGTWVISGSPIIKQITLSGAGDRFTIAFRFVDGSTAVEVAKEIEGGSGRAFKWDSPSGDYIHLKRSGGLELRDRIGLVATGREK